MSRAELPDRTVVVSDDGSAASVRADQAKRSDDERHWYGLTCHSGQWSVIDTEDFPYSWMPGDEYSIPGPPELYDLVIATVGAR